MRLKMITEAGTKLTRSMLEFVNEAVPELYYNYDKFHVGQPKDSNEVNMFPTSPLWKYNGPRIDVDYWGSGALVVGPDGLKLGIFVIGANMSQPGNYTGIAQLYWPDEESDWGTGFEPFGVIHINQKHLSSIEHFREVFVHELNHLFDPKERTTHPAYERSNIDFRRNQDEQIEYSQQVHEIDAIMTSLADRRLYEFELQGLSDDEIKAELRRLKPLHEFERSLVRYGKWKQYLQTIYRMSQNRGTRSGRVS